MKTFAIAVAALSLLTMACGRQDKIYIDPAAGSVGVDVHTSLPDQFADQSVNSGVVDVTSNSGTYEVRFRLLGGSAPAGSFNLASATGSRAILGIGAFDKTLLSDFKFAVSSTSATGSKLRLSLLLDLKCDGSAVRTLESDEIANGTDVAIAASDSVWSLDGSATKSSLGEVTTANPAACLRNAVSTADDLPKGLSLGSVLLSIGTSSSTDIQSLIISDLKISGATYTSLSSSWGKQ